MHRPSLPAADLARFDALCKDGDVAAGDSHAAESLEKYRQALTIDDRFAALHFRLGRALLALDRKDEARQHFVLARDLDTIQFRTPSSLNRIIREKCAGRTSEGIRLVNAEAAFAGHPKAADGIPGREMFWEHVHLTFDGNHALATAILPQLERVLPAQSVGAAQGGADLSRDRCAQRLVYNPISERGCAMAILKMLGEPPSCNQYDSADRKASMRREVYELSQRCKAADPARYFALFDAALAANPNDWRLHQAYAEVLAEYGRTATAAEHLRQVLRIVPQHPTADIRLAPVLLAEGKSDAAIECYHNTIRKFRRLLPDQETQLAIAVAQLGDAYEAQGKHDQAMAQWREAIRVHAKCSSAGMAIARALAAKGKKQEAIAELRATLNDEPREMHRAMASFYCGIGEYDQAADEYGQTLANAAADAVEQADAGAFFLMCGKADAALQRFRDAVRLDPRNVEYRHRMADVLGLSGHPDDAVKEYQRILSIREDADACYALACVAMGKGLRAEAEEWYRRTIAVNPRHASAQNNLGQFLMARRENEQAMVHLRAAIDANPQHGGAHGGLGIVLERMGHSAEALGHLRKAIELKQTTPESLRCRVDPRHVQRREASQRR